MPRILTLTVALGALLGFTPAAEAAWTVDGPAPTTLNCRTGQIVPPAPDDAGVVFTPASDGSGTFSVDALIVNQGATLKLLGALVSDSTSDAVNCTIDTTKGTIVSGTISYDQGDGVVAKNPAGRVNVTSKKIVDVPGAITANGRNSNLLNGVLASANGGDGGYVNVRAPRIDIAGTLASNGGDGADAGSNLAAGNGGKGGTVSATGDSLANLTGSLTTVGGIGGGGLLSPVRPAGANGVAGLVRRNAFTGATGGTVNAASKPVNQAPIGLSAAGAAVGVALHWTDRSDEDQGFVVARRVEGSTYKVIGQVGAGVTSYNDFGPFEGGKTYEYAVLPKFASDVWSYAMAFSNVAKIAIPAAAIPQAPTKGSGKPKAGGRFKIKTGSLRKSYKLAKNATFLKLKVQSLGDGQLRIQMPVKVGKGSKGHSRLVTKTFDVNSGMNLLRLRLPVSLRSGSYKVTFTTIADDGSTSVAHKLLKLVLGGH